MHACPACRAATPEGARFCPACGRPLIVPETPAERKVVTTLFCDLVGFTRLSENADPEDVDSMLRQYAAAASHAVEIHGGVVEKFIGDGVVAVFGVPAAHEDDAERAVHAALRICREVSGVIAPDGSPVSVRIGMNTGEALARLDCRRHRRRLPRRRRRQHGGAPSARRPAGRYPGRTGHLRTHQQALPF